MYKVFSVLLIIGLILTVFRLMAQIDAIPPFPGDEWFDQYSVPSLLILVAGLIGTSIFKPKKEQ